jgi:hypothetical protein
MSVMEKYYQFRISLNEVVPEIWRTFQISELHSLFDLHQVIQVVMGWENDHLFQFKKDGKWYGLIDDEDLVSTKMLDADETLLHELNLKEGESFEYEYDFGDCWIHTLKLQKIVTLEENLLPIAFAGANACPFEDCGGPAAYMELKEALLNPKNEEEMEMKETMGDFDPSFFDLEEVNEILADIEEGDWFDDEDENDDEVDFDDFDDDIFDDFDDDVKKN